MTLRVSLFLVLLSMPFTVFAQGALEPPAPPAPTMKTLDQVEPRKPVSEPIFIAEAGSYYLTNDINGSIIIGADGVTLDLNGFTVTPMSSTAIRVSNRDNVKIFNGTIAGGTGTGIAGSPVGSILVSDLQLLDITGECTDLNNPSGMVTGNLATEHGSTAFSAR